MGGDSDARRRLGVEAEAPATTAAPTTPDEEAREILEKFARYAVDWLKSRTPDGFVAPYSAIQVRMALLAGAEALEQVRGLTPAERAELAVLRHSNTQMRDLTREQDQTIKTLADRNATLEVHTAELRGLLQRTLYYVGRWGSKRVELSDQIHAALADQPPQRGRELLAKVERLEAKIAELQPQVDNWHAYLRWRAKQDDQGEAQEAGGEREHHDGCKERGLHRKYEVRRTDRTDVWPDQRHFHCEYFVFDLTHDPLARHVLATAYADGAEAEGRHALARDLRALAASEAQP